MARLKGALIGCGFFAVNQLHAWRMIDAVEIVAICDRDPARLAAVGDSFGIARRYADAAALLSAERLDFVDVATTVASHRALVEMAAAARIPVICQKPIAPTYADARAMVEACEAAGVPLMIHENFRWQSPIRAVRAAIDAGRIGTPFFGRVSFRSAYDVFAGQPYLAEGERFIIEDLGIHILDIARYLFGDATSVTARTRRINPRIRGEDVATMLLDHASGVTSVVDCSYASRLEEELFPQTLVEVDGSAGTIRLERDYRLVVTTADGSTVTDAAPPVLQFAAKPWHVIQESVYRIEAHWADCLASGREPDTSGRDNLKTFALVEAAYLGARTGRPVALSEVTA